MNSIEGIESADGPLLVLLVGLGAVSTSFLAGVELIRRGVCAPVGSLTQMHQLNGGVSVCEAVPLAGLVDLCFVAWDPLPDSALEAARVAGVLSREHIDSVAGFLDEIHPLPAVFDQAFVPPLDGPNVKTDHTRLESVEALRHDIRVEMERHGAARAVMIWCASTEVYAEAGPSHQDLRHFEAALERDDSSLPPSQLYAYAALQEGVPFVNAAPNLTIDLPAMVELATQQRVPICGKDLKTGQTLLKTILAPGLQSRMLGVEGWFSVNMLGNRDGVVLEDPSCFRAKEVTKKRLLEELLDAPQYPSLYGTLDHSVAINYYRPRGDAKEAWDNIDIFGWLGYPMQLKINFLCRDSILAAPLVLDLVLLTDLAQRAGYVGVQDWLAFYFKCPQQRDGQVSNVLHAQHAMLMDTLSKLAATTTPNLSSTTGT